MKLSVEQHEKSNLMDLEKLMIFCYYWVINLFYKRINLRLNVGKKGSLTNTQPQPVKPH